MKQIAITLTFILIGAVVASDAAARDGALVRLTSEVLREVVVEDESGTKITQLVPATSAMPGEVLTFAIRYLNDGDGEARDIILTNPVPEHMVYEDQSAEGEGSVVTFSVDGGVNYWAPGSLTVTGDDGRKRAAVAADYTHIRWRLTEPIPPGGSGSVSFKASVK